MPISYNFKTIFVHIPKAAGTSIEKYLGMGSIKELFSYKPVKETGLIYDDTLLTLAQQNELANVTPQHIRAEILQQILPSEVFNSFWKFTVARHPYTKMLSEYSYVNKEHIPKLIEFKGLSFTAFLSKAFALEEDLQVSLFDNHLASQKSFIVNDNGDLLVDSLFKFEELEACIVALQERTKASATFPHSRQTTSSADLSLLSDESKELIYQKFKEDFDFFSYDAA
jgi:hypothetical protein